MNLATLLLLAACNLIVGCGAMVITGQLALIALNVVAAFGSFVLFSLSALASPALAGLAWIACAALAAAALMSFGLRDGPSAARLRRAAA